MTSGYTIRIVRLAAGGTTPFDGQYLVSYDPSLVVFHQSYEKGLVTTRDHDKAKRFASNTEAWECWKLPSGYSYPQDKPLTAFTVEIRPVGMEAGR